MRKFVGQTRRDPERDDPATRVRDGYEPGAMATARAPGVVRLAERVLSTSPFSIRRDATEASFPPDRMNFRLQTGQVRLLCAGTRGDGTG